MKKSKLKNGRDITTEKSFQNMTAKEKILQHSNETVTVVSMQL